MGFAQLFLEKCLHLVQGVGYSSVVYFLALEVEGAHELAIPFEHILPRLNVLRPLYHRLRADLHLDR